MLTELSNDIATIVESSAPSVLQVIGHHRPISGLAYSNDVVLTLMSGLGREEGLQVRRADGNAFSAELIGWDPATSLAVLRVPGLGATPISPAASAVKVGHIGIAIGRSWSNVVSASAGIIAVIGGPLATGPRRAIDQVFRITAPIHDGFAGGAHVDASGGLIGITTARSIRGFGVVIPASIAWKAAAHVVQHGRTKRGYLGIAGQSVRLPEQQRGGTGRERAVVTLAVTPGGPAANAGVMIGDLLLTLDGEPIESPEQLMDLLMTIGTGRSTRLQLLRGGTLTELSVNVSERPMS